MQMNLWSWAWWSTAVSATANLLHWCSEFDNQCSKGLVVCWNNCFRWIFNYKDQNMYKNCRFLLPRIAFWVYPWYFKMEILASSKNLAMIAKLKRSETDNNIYICRMTNYELLRWLVETRSRDVGHNRTLHSWASDRSTFFHSVTMLHGYFRYLPASPLPPKLHLICSTGGIYIIPGISTEYRCSRAIFTAAKLFNYYVRNTIIISIC